MFIALSLFVIAQMVGKKVKERASMSIEVVQAELAALRVQCEEAERKKETRWLSQNGIQTADVGIIYNILDERAEQAALFDSVIEAEGEVSKLLALHREQLAEKAEVANGMVQLENDQTLLEEENRYLEEKIRSVSQGVASLTKEIEGRQISSETLVFSLEHSSHESDVEYTIFLINGRLYDERTISESPIPGKARNYVQVSPKGTGVACTPESLQLYFKNINQQFSFVHIWVGDESFNSLLSLKRFLRKVNYPVSWTYSSDFRFIITSGAIIRGVSQ